MINKTILKINSCLISVSDKTGINRIAKKLNDKGINIISTGNTYKAYIPSLEAKYGSLSVCLSFHAI